MGLDAKSGARMTTRHSDFSNPQTPTVLFYVISVERVLLTSGALRPGARQLAAAGSRGRRREGGKGGP